MFAGLLVSALAIVNCSAPQRSFGSGSQGSAANIGSGANPVANTAHPSWLAGTYTDPGKVEDNISSAQRSISLSADGTYTGFYCKSCDNQPGKWSVVDDKIVFDGGIFIGSASLDDFSSNCRILNYANTRLYRQGVVPDCPLGGKRATSSECEFVGTYHQTGSGDVSDSSYVSVEPDHFWYAERTHTYCVSNKFGSKCLIDISYDFDTWTVSGGAIVGPPTDGLSFQPGDCATYGETVANGSAGSGSGGAAGAASGGSAAGASSSGGTAGASSGGSAAGASSSEGTAGASSGGSAAGASSGGSAAGASSSGGAAGASSAGKSGAAGASSGGSGGSAG